MYINRRIIVSLELERGKEKKEEKKIKFWNNFMWRKKKKKKHLTSKHAVMRILFVVFKLKI